MVSADSCAGAAQTGKFMQLQGKIRSTRAQSASTHGDLSRCTNERTASHQRNSALAIKQWCSCPSGVKADSKATEFTTLPRGSQLHIHPALVATLPQTLCADSCAVLSRKSEPDEEPVCKRETLLSLLPPRAPRAAVWARQAGADRVREPCIHTTMRISQRGPPLPILHARPSACALALLRWTREPLCPLTCSSIRAS